MKGDDLNLKGLKKIAIMGGTFDPIHYGHLTAAQSVKEELGIEKVIFMPTGAPPHKQGCEITSPYKRYAMTMLATLDNPAFLVSDYETKKQTLCYSIETVSAIKKLCDEDCELYFIIGADSVEELSTWYKPDKLLKLCRIAAVTRPEVKNSVLREKVAELEKKYDADIRLLEIPSLSISSTNIRGRVFAGKSIAYLTPSAVAGFIAKEELYTDRLHPQLDGIDLGKIKLKLHYELSPKRFLHTRGVAEEAYKLANKYGLDPSRAYLAGILHDCAKDFSRDRSFDLCKNYDVPLDEVLTAQPDLIHSFLGAAVAKNEYGITDDEVLSAIRYHTTGKENMSTLEKIIYLADCIEPSRKNYDGLEKTRHLTYTNLDKAMNYVLNSTISYNVKKNRLIHPLSLRAAEYYAKQGE